MKLDLRFEGSADLKARLAELVAESTSTQGRNAVRKALRATMAPVQAQAQGDVPERPLDAPVKRWGRKRGDPPTAGKIRKPGTAHVLLQIGPTLTRNQARQNRADGKSMVEMHVGTRDPIARLLHFGTDKIPPLRFLTRAWEAHLPNLLPALGRHMGVEFDKWAQRIARKAARKTRR